MYLQNVNNQCIYKEIGKLTCAIQHVVGKFSLAVVHNLQKIYHIPALTLLFLLLLLLLLLSLPPTHLPLLVLEGDPLLLCRHILETMKGFKGRKKHFK